MEFQEYKRLYLIPIYSNEQEEILETFLRDNGYRFSIPTKPPKSIFDKDFKLKAKEKS